MFNGTKRMEQWLQKNYPHIQKEDNYIIKNIPVTINQIDEMIYTSHLQRMQEDIIFSIRQ